MQIEDLAARTSPNFEGIEQRCISQGYGFQRALTITWSDFPNTDISLTNKRTDFQGKVLHSAYELNDHLEGEDVFDNKDPQCKFL